MNAVDAYTAGLVAADGHADWANERIRIALSEPGWPVLEYLASHYERNLSAPRNNGSRALDLRLPLEWKIKIPDFGQHQRHYLRGLYDGDGSLTWCTTKGFKQPHVDFAFGKGGEVFGCFVREFLRTSNFAFHESVRPDCTVLMVGNWLHTGELAGYLYRKGDLAIPAKRIRAQLFESHWLECLLRGSKSWYLEKDTLRI